MSGSHVARGGWSAKVSESWEKFANILCCATMMWTLKGFPSLSRQCGQWIQYNLICSSRAIPFLKE
ncbi:hypothetical protein COCCADRAFT_86728 [Bipolaris zeicola 26-R-13]|uniref:Uncharacterized protein n=1 Tax=Cochliobolus carbonum (strain 26-R-13) TaxID=930089 RepID=W6YH04_COCC2|nr:uncharacterized protein COCCADRAFT_86728 [Bipolaris zeicola 26-R-13]EUC36988.1 hypothetical protein COCCADRAFT_86728 [Bipolaris zeicola 26-R-13]